MEQGGQWVRESSAGVPGGGRVQTSFVVHFGTFCALKQGAPGAVAHGTSSLSIGLGEKRGGKMSG